MDREEFTTLTLLERAQYLEPLLPRLEPGDVWDLAAACWVQLPYTTQQAIITGRYLDA